MFSKFLNQLDHIVNSFGSSVKETEETWSNLKMTGKGHGIPIEEFKTFFNEFEETGNIGLASITVDKENIENCLDDFYDQYTSCKEWSININKAGIRQVDDTSYNFFYQYDVLKKWIEECDPISGNNPINKGKWIVDVFGYEDVYISPSLILSNGSKDNLNFLTLEAGVSNSLIKDIVISKINNNVIIQPSEHHIRLIEETKNKQDTDSIEYKNSILSCLFAICNEIISYDSNTKKYTIVLDGIAREEEEIKINYISQLYTKDTNELFYKIVKWVYSDENNFKLRQKLLMDRLTIEISCSTNTSNDIDKILLALKPAFEQAEERFKYAVYHKLDDYRKDRKDLMKDLRDLSKLYSGKIRSLISSLSRDVLAGILLVGITLLVKVSDKPTFSNKNLLRYVCVAYGIYFAISFLIQAVNDWIDIHRTNDEFDKWQKETDDYMPRNKFFEIKKETIGEREKNFVRQYIAIGVIYMILASYCMFGMSNSIKTILNSQPKDTNVTKTDKVKCSINEKVHTNKNVTKQIK